jgi:hypothetical protein
MNIPKTDTVTPPTFQWLGFTRRSLQDGLARKRPTIRGPKQGPNLQIPRGPGITGTFREHMVNQQVVPRTISQEYSAMTGPYRIAVASDQWRPVPLRHGLSKPIQIGACNLLRTAHLDVVVLKIIVGDKEVVKTFSESEDSTLNIRGRIRG